MKDDVDDGGGGVAEAIRVRQMQPQHRPRHTRDLARKRLLVMSSHSSMKTIRGNSGRGAKGGQQQRSQRHNLAVLSRLPVARTGNDA
jgi:hypothetical protein